MSRRFPGLTAAICLFCGCAGTQALKPVEMLDDRTGMTLAGLRGPIELVRPEVPVAGRRLSTAYLGPVEWNRMGTITHGLWVHLAQGNDAPLADMRGPGALSVTVDDGAFELRLIQAPVSGRELYRPVVPWGQTAYFDLSVPDLRRLAASSRLVLHCAAVDGSTVLFSATGSTGAVFGEYLQSRGLTGD